MTTVMRGNDRWCGRFLNVAGATDNGMSICS
jgi:hypothetical protein